MSPERTCESAGSVRTTCWPCSRASRSRRPASRSARVRPAFAPPALRRGRLSRRRVTYLAGALLIVVGMPRSVAVQRHEEPPSLAIGRITHVTSEPGLELDPAIAPDGRTIAYAAGAGGPDADLCPAAHRRPHRAVDGRGLRGRATVAAVVTRRLAHRVPGRSSADHSRVAASGGDAVSGARARRRAEKTVRSVSGGVAVAPSWSPDGTRIAFGGSDGLYIVVGGR